MSTVVAPFFAISGDRQHLTILYGCSCGWRSATHNLGEPNDPARAEVRGHLADEHGAEFDVGRCSTCGEPTDYFRAHFPRPDGAGEHVEIVDLYECEQHGPRPMVLDQGDAGDQGDDQGDAGDQGDAELAAEPYSVLRSARFTYRDGIGS